MVKFLYNLLCSTQQSCYDLATAQNVTTQTQTSYQVDLYHNSDPREARMRRKLSMIQKASKRRCIVSGTIIPLY